MSTLKNSSVQIVHTYQELKKKYSEHVRSTYQSNENLCMNGMIRKRC